MSGVTFTTPIARGQDPDGDIEFIGINYKTGRVFVRFACTPSGQNIDTVYEGPDLAALRGRVAQYNGLKLAQLQDMIAQGKIPSGSVT